MSKKKDKKKDSVDEVTEVETKDETPVVEETKVDETPVVEEAKVDETPDDENNGEGVSTQTAAKAKKSKGGKVKFKRSCHQKMYDKVDPKGRAAQVLVKRFAI